MTGSPKVPPAADGDLVAADDMKAALTAGTLVFEDGSTQTFSTDGRTTYIENDRPTEGEWSVVENGKFSSFWPPSYRATYSLRWIIEGDNPVGLRFTDDAQGRRFDGRYR
ncbi:hypothetical protein AB0J74_27115 [Asanoa sp. NPDC049573]|uniref:hypothetical protein n=1 Tax=Asanoa sp. NPDC049573 TaxID=3155396 RepID=UPI0034383F82